MEQKNPIIAYPRKELALRKLSLRRAMRAANYWQIAGAQDAIVEAEDFMHSLEVLTGEPILSTTRKQIRMGGKHVS